MHLGKEGACAPKGGFQHGAECLPGAGCTPPNSMDYSRKYHCALRTRVFGGWGLSGQAALARAFPMRSRSVHSVFLRIKKTRERVHTRARATGNGPHPTAGPAFHT